MQKTKLITRLFSTFLMCQILLFSVYGKAFSVEQAHSSGDKKYKLEQSNEHINQFGGSSLRTFSEIQHAPAGVDLCYPNDPLFFTTFLSKSYSCQLRFRKVSVSSFPLNEILFENFIATNAP